MSDDGEQSNTHDLRGMWHGRPLRLDRPRLSRALHPLLQRQGGQCFGAGALRACPARAGCDNLLRQGAARVPFPDQTARGRDGARGFRAQGRCAGGYQFEILGEPNGDPLPLRGSLMERIRRSLSVKYLVRDAGGARIADQTVCAGSNGTHVATAGCRCSSSTVGTYRGTSLGACS